MRGRSAVGPVNEAMRPANAWHVPSMLRVAHAQGSHIAQSGDLHRRRPSTSNVAIKVGTCRGQHLGTTRGRVWAMTRHLHVRPRGPPAIPQQLRRPGSAESCRACCGANDASRSPRRPTATGARRGGSLSSPRSIRSRPPRPIRGRQVSGTPSRQTRSPASWPLVTSPPRTAYGGVRNTVHSPLRGWADHQVGKPRAARTRPATDADCDTSASSPKDRLAAAQDVPGRGLERGRLGLGLQDGLRRAIKPPRAPAK